MVEPSNNTRAQESGAAITRRGSLLSLGAMAFLAAVTDPAAAGAGKKGKRGKKARKQRQVRREQCVTFVEEQCEGNAECLAEFTQCCAFFGKSQIGAGLECILSSLI